MRPTRPILAIQLIGRDSWICGWEEV